MKINARGMRKKILRLYGEDRRVADDDLLLIAQIWAGEGWTSSLSVYQNLRRVSSPETIRSTRQKLVEEGLIKPSAEATEHRYEEFKKARASL